MANLLEKFQCNFSNALRQAGAACCTSLVRIWGGDDRISCEFPEDQHLTAHFILDNHRLMPQCQCSDYLAHRPCKHLWAVLLTADKFQDLTLALKRNVPSKIQFSSQENESGEYQYVKEKSRPQRIEGRADDEGRIIVPLEHTPRTFHAPVPGKLGIASNPCQEILYVLRPDKQENLQEMVLETWWRQSTPVMELHSQPSPTTPVKPFIIDDTTLVPSRLDEQLLSRLMVFTANFPYRYNVPARVTEIFDLLSTTPHFRWADTSSGSPKMRPLTHPLGITAEFQLSIGFTSDARFCITPILRLPDKTIPFSQIRQIAQGAPNGGYALAEGRLLQCKFHGAAAIAQSFIGSDSIIMDFAEAKTLARNIALISDMDTSAFPEPIAVQILESIPSGELYIQTAKYKYKDAEQLHAVLSYNYDGTSCPDDNAPKAAVKNSIVIRNQAMEQELKEQLYQLGFRYNTKAYLEEIGWKLLPAQLDNVVHTLTYEGWNITAEGKTYRRPITKQNSVKSGLDWFELENGVSFDGQEIPLPTLLAAYKAGKKTVRLDDGTLGLLPMEWLANYTVLTEIGEVCEDRIRFRISQAALITSILGERLAENSPHLQTQLNELKKLSQPMPALPPSDFKATLRDYQAIGLGWLENMQRAGLGACLADDMGLGKTIQVLALLAKRPKSSPPSLIVMPKSLIFNWLAEIQKFTPRLTAIVHTGSGRDCSPEQLSRANLVLTTYGTMRNDATKLASFQFDYCILDESQAIKNYDSSTARAVRCIKANYRLTMTGTPIENHLGELFSQLDFLNPGLFGREKVSVAPAPNNTSENSLVNRIRNGVRPFILRRTKQEVAKELPPKTVQTLYCQMNESDQEEYDQLLKYYQKQLLEADGPQNAAMQTLAALTRLRQAACHPGLIKPERAQDSSAKLELLLELLGSIIPAGHKALIFSQFTSFLKVIRTQLENAGYSLCYLDGTTQDRAEVVREFQENPQRQLFLISLKAGGTGLNLTKADYVFIMDPWWNPAAEAQAIDRAYRIGQTNPVMAYKLATKNTIEEKLLTLQQNKQALADAIVNTHTDAALPFSMEDIRQLLRPHAYASGVTSAMHPAPASDSQA